MKTDAESNPPKRIYLKDYQAPAYQVLSIHLFFNLNETQTQVTATTRFRQLRQEPLVLNGENLKLISAHLNEKKLAVNDFAVNEKTLTLENPGAEFTLQTLVEINPEANKSCQGLYLSQGIFATQCEAEGFRNITYALDRPDVMTSYTVEIEADEKKYPVLLSNGDLIEKKKTANGRHRAIWKDPFKKPSYLFALVAGDIGVIEDSFVTRSGKKIKLEVFASHGKQSRCHFAMESLKKAMKWDEERFGLEYDLNQFMLVSIDDFNMGAMENKGLNIFNSRLVLADPNSATDTDFDRIESVVGHEYFHNWTGNRVTCRNWFELSLKEGLTVFRDQEFSSDLNSRAVQRIKDVDALRTRQFAEDAGPNAHPVRPDSCLSVDNFYTATIYEKGSEVIRMLQTIVGQKGFRSGMDEYFKRHDGQAVTILDFAAAIAEPNDVDLTQFKLWYTQSGTPTVEVNENYDGAKKEYALTLTQTTAPTTKQPKTEPFFIPLRIGLLSADGKDMDLRCQDLAINSDQQPLLHLRQKTQTFIFSNVAVKPVLSLNRDFSAPIKLLWNATQADLIHLIKFDSDAFNRREASYKMTLQELKRLIGAAGRGQTLEAEAGIIDALGFIIKDQNIDPQFKALMLQLPNEDILAQECEVLDAVAFEKAYRCIDQTLVARFETQLWSLYRSHHAVDSSKDRALKNRVLHILMGGGSDLARSSAFKQFNEARNMTDKLSALAILCSAAGTEKNQALDQFYSEWKDDAVVYNKWLQVQATIPAHATFAQVKKLSEMKPFSFDNPNNIYSLLGVFGDNYLAMHDETGETYRWLCDHIAKIDAKNPLVASRLCGSFNFVRKLPTVLREKAQGEIRQLLANPELSKNSRELLEGCV